MLNSSKIRTYGFVLAVLFMVGPAWGATVVYVDSGATGAGDGTSWADACTSVQPALDAAAAGDQVWVAAGTYVENIVLRDAVALYGGFAGTEDPATFDLADRDLTAHETILDGNEAGSVVTVPSTATLSTRLDGFTIVSGSASGVYCDGAATIANNLIIGNKGVSGGGIQLGLAAPRIVNNVIAGNSANSGGGIFCGYAPAVIANNTITGNTASSGGGGIYSGGEATLIVNTIVAFNSSGIHLLDASAVLSHNCVYGNTVYDYSGVADPTGTNGNISVDPRLAGAGYKNWHIQPDSPCVDAGDSNHVYANVDFDGQTRILPAGGTADIGADESDGTAWPDGPNVIVRVSPAGDDANDGSSWPLAKRTVQAGIDAASGPGGEVWVQAGTYPERITLYPFAHVCGGFAGTESERDARDWTAHVTVLDGEQQGSVVTALAGHRVSTIDGFTITNGNGTPIQTSRYGGGIYCYNGSPKITNNTITGNAASGGGGIYSSYAFPEVASNRIVANTAGFGGAARLNNDSSFLIGNEILRNTATHGGGVCLHGSSAKVSGCLFAGNIAAQNGGGICDNSVKQPAIINSVFSGNHADSGGGVYLAGTGTVVTNCTFSGNSAANGGGLYRVSGASGPAPVVANCVFWGNTADVVPEVFDVTPTYCNIRGGEPGLGIIDADPLFIRSPGSGADGVWGTEDDDYGDLRLQPTSPCIDAGSNAAVPTGSITDLAGGPRFLDDPDVPDTGSGMQPIVDMGAYEGTAPVVATPVFDPEGGAYNAPLQVTITCTTPGAIIHYTTDGCDPTEDDPTVEAGESVSVSTESPTTLKAKAWNDGLEPSGVKTAVYWRPVIIFVTLDGDDANDGSSWATAKRTVQAGINAAQAGDWVWVAAGIYTPTGDGDRAKSFAMKPGVTLYGGFAGTEDPTVFTPTDRDLNANETILSGDLLGNDNGQVAHDEPTRQDNSFHVVVGADDAILDGFTVTRGNANGESTWGAGMHISWCRPTVVNCVFRANAAAGRGGGMYNDMSKPTLIDCRFVDNQANEGGGVHNGQGDIVLLRCAFIRNTAAGGGGVFNDISSKARHSRLRLRGQLRHRLTRWWRYV